MAEILEQVAEVGTGQWYSQVLGAIARGWCSEENENKPMDPTLASAIAVEIRLLYSEPEDRENLKEIIDG